MSIENNPAIKKLLDDFAIDKPNESYQEQGEAVDSLIKAIAKTSGHIKNPELHKGLEALKLKIESWDSENPDEAISEKIIKKASKGEFASAAIYAENAVAQKKQQVDSVLDGYKKENASKRHLKNNEIKKLALEHYLNDPLKFKDKKAAARYLEKNYPPLSFRTYYDELTALK